MAPANEYRVTAEVPRRRYYPKRFLDICLALVGLILLSPIMLLIGLAVQWKLGSPVFFVQSRPGLRGRPFDLVKFRTMVDVRDESGQLRQDADRLTPFGHALRSTSLDELPELWNVLKGEMSLVGPRPLLSQYLDLYTPFQMRRHEVRPGITGWAQVNGRNALSWPDKFALDIWYVDNLRFSLDFKILLLTLARVASRGGISGEGEATVGYFQGNADEKASPMPPQAKGGRSGTEA